MLVFIPLKQYEFNGGAVPGAIDSDTPEHSFNNRIVELVADILNEKYGAVTCEDHPDHVVNIGVECKAIPEGKVTFTPSVPCCSKFSAEIGDIITHLKIGV